MSLVISVVGARPNFMKAAPVQHAIGRAPGIRHLLVHTGQHYDPSMSDVFFQELGMGKPDMYLGIGSGSHAEQTARVMVEFEKICLAQNPDLVLVYGDVNSTMAAAIVAKKLNIAVGHVESGLRSYDMRMPEEVNRIVTDAITDLYFVTEESGRQVLLRQGTPSNRIHFVGNTMIDSLASLCARLGDVPDEDTPCIVLTLHRPSNVDNPEGLKKLLDAVQAGAGDCLIKFPVHPRTEAVLRSQGLYQQLASGGQWQLLGPAGYRQFIEMVRGARAVVTDSGGIQEETTWLGVPCVTLRQTTERPSTVELGTNQLVGIQPDMVTDAIRRAVEYGGNKANPIRPVPPPLWDGQAAGRIVNVIVRYLQAHRERQVNS